MYVEWGKYLNAAILFKVPVKVDSDYLVEIRADWPKLQASRLAHNYYLQCPYQCHLYQKAAMRVQPLNPSLLCVSFSFSWFDTGNLPIYDTDFDRDLAPISSDSEARKALAAEIRNACINVGFFYGRLAAWI